MESSHLLFTYPAFLEVRVRGVKPVLLGGEQLVLPDLPGAAARPRHRVVRAPRLPGVRVNHLAQLPLLLALLADHPGDPQASEKMELSAPGLG